MFIYIYHKYCSKIDIEVSVNVFINMRMEAKVWVPVHFPMLFIAVMINTITHAINK